MVMSRDQNTERFHSVELDNSSVESLKNSHVWEQP